MWSTKVGANSICYDSITPRQTHSRKMHLKIGSSYDKGSVDSVIKLEHIYEWAWGVNTSLPNK